MGGEAATRLNAGLPELDDCVLRPVDCGKHVRLVEPDVKRVVRLLPHFLQDDERVGKATYPRRKRHHRLLVPAGGPRSAVLQGAVHLMPCLAAASADEQVGRRAGQAMEHRVVRSADRAAQVRLRRPPADRPPPGRGPWPSNRAGSRLKPSRCGDGAILQPAAGLSKAPGPRPLRSGSGRSRTGVMGTPHSDYGSFHLPPSGSSSYWKRL